MALAELRANDPIERDAQCQARHDVTEIMCEQQDSGRRERCDRRPDKATKPIRVKSGPRDGGRDGNESQALPERGIPWRRPWTTTRSGRLRSTKRLNRCGSKPATGTQHSMWSARRTISMSRLINRAYVQKSRVAPSPIFSSASQVTTRSVRSISGVAARAHARLRTRSPRVGGKVIRPRWEARFRCEP
jgi:hypothetical protein